MSPTRFPQEQKSSLIMNGPRPSPLKIGKESHVIHKASNGNNPVVVDHLVSKQHQQQQMQRRTQPVIIYTQSPKVIHTQARDFMALVQKLTGLSSSTNEETAPQDAAGSSDSIRLRMSERVEGVVGKDDNDSSSVLTDDHCRVSGGTGPDVVSPALKAPNNNNPFLADIPLFTPTAGDFFYSPRPLYRYSDATSYASPGNLTSPSVLEFLKGLPEY